MSENYVPGACSLERAVSSTKAITELVRRPGAVPFEPSPAVSPEAVMSQVWERRAERLHEELEEQWALRDLPRKMFSIKLYLDHMANEVPQKAIYSKGYRDAYMIVYNKNLELSSYDWSATWDKYREYFKHQYKTIPKEKTRPVNV